DRVVALLRERERYLLVAFAVQQQERAGDLLHHSVEAEPLQLLHGLVPGLHVEDPQQVLPGNRQRRGLARIEPVEALLPDLPVVPLSAPGDAARVTLLEGRRA